jgi:NAD(P)-dependent dehydrogenase (short-subunit alcohol dehydrogenase family)
MSAPEFRVDGAVALVTGAGTGMGRATALALAGAGAAHIYVCGRRPEPLRETVATIRAASPQCVVTDAAVDVTVPAARQALLARIQRDSARLDVLVNNAGLFHGDTLDATTDESWQAIYDVNVTAPFALIRDALPLLACSSSASVVNISSTLAVKPIPVAAAYNSAKAALVQLTRSLALELGPKRIRVNGIMPAIVETPMYRGRFPDEKDFRAALDGMASQHPLGRVGQPEDVAGAVLFLASRAAAWITGVNLPVDGGMLCT